jgi:3-dehydroquinate dehydratase
LREFWKLLWRNNQGGADVVKIVTEANSEEELMDNFNITLALKEKLNVPFLFLCNGTHCKKHRTLAPLLTNDMFLVVENSNENLGQPTIKKAKEILTLAGYDNLP